MRCQSWVLFLLLLNVLATVNCFMVCKIVEIWGPMSKQDIYSHMLILVGLNYFQLACCFSDMQARKKTWME